MTLWDTVEVFLVLGVVIMSETDTLEFWTCFLHLPEFQVAHFRQDSPTDPVRLTLIPKNSWGLCPNCGRLSETIQRRSESEPVKDLPLGPHQVDLVIRVYQFACPQCGRFFTPTYDAFVPGGHATERFLEQAARLIRFSDIANAAAFFAVPEKTLERWYYDYVERKRQTPIAKVQPIRQLGIDELRLTKHDQFVAVMIDHTNQRVLEVLENRTKDRVRAYLRQGKGNGQLAHLVEVTTDMWDGYVEAVHEVFGSAVRVTIDRFHVMKNFQDHLAAARREIQRQLPKAEAKALKGSRWLWMTNRDNLTPEEQNELAGLEQQFPSLKQLADQREQLRAIFEDQHIHTTTAGAKRLREWMAQAQQLGLKALDAFCATLTNWLDKIANYFIERASNGRTEGFNNGLRSILRRAFGMFNFNHFRLRVLDRFGQPNTP
jgi:transposase